MQGAQGEVEEVGGGDGDNAQGAGHLTNHMEDGLHKRMSTNPKQVHAGEASLEI